MTCVYRPACVYRPCYHNKFFIDMEKEDSCKDVMDAFCHYRDFSLDGINYVLTLESNSVHVKWSNGEVARFPPIVFRSILEHFKASGECHFCYLDEVSDRCSKCSLYMHVSKK